MGHKIGQQETDICPNAVVSVHCAHVTSTASVYTFRLHVPCVAEPRNVFAWPVIEEARRLDYSNISLFMGVLALYCLLFRTLAFLAIFRLKHNRRT